MAAEYEKIEQLTERILNDYEQGRDIDKMDVIHQPDSELIQDIVAKLLRILFPGYYRERIYKGHNEKSHLRVLIEDVLYNLEGQIATALWYHPDYEGTERPVREEAAADLTLRFADRIPVLREYINTDLQAFFEGDPAADSKDEIVLCYPGLYAITLNRIAHELFALEVPLIPRMITEHAHGKTGIDIHPGATIGKYFFIDHGTGVVIGSSTEIGDHVKVYQGVTLGALSTRKGQLLHGVKRHPTIEDDVTIYSGASILGGETVIGKGSVIGGNCFITASVPENSRVSMQNQEIAEKTDSSEDSWFYII